MKKRRETPWSFTLGDWGAAGDLKALPPRTTRSRVAGTAEDRWWRRFERHSKALFTTSTRLIEARSQLVICARARERFSLCAG